jgi:low temperature requirement protein LtrA
LSESSAGGEVKRASPLELFFDLVFVFALTQVTALMADAGDWAGIGEGMLVLVAIWWAWAAYAWLTNEADPAATRVRLAVFAAMVAMLIAALAVPGAFEDDALLFACAYLAVRVIHIGLFAAATDDAEVLDAVRALGPPAVIAPAFLIGAAFLDGWAQAAVWIVVLAVDWVLGSTRGIGGWRLSPGYFAERHGLIVIIALGESIVAIGVGLAGVDLGVEELVTAGLGVAIAAGLWWLYFDRAAEAGEEAVGRAGSGLERNTMARDSYSILHVAIAAGIVLLALGTKKALGDVGEPLKAVAAFAACGGLAVYMLGQLGFRVRTRQPFSRALAGGAVAALAAIPLALTVDAIWALAALLVVTVAVVAWDRAAAPAAAVGR